MTMTPDPDLFRWLAGLAIVATSAVSIYHRRRADRAGDAISFRAETLPVRILTRGFGGATWLAVFATILTPGIMAWSTGAPPPALRWLGAATVAAGPLLFLWVFRHLGGNVTSTVVTRRHHTLVTTGPYRWVRHPLYSVGVLFMLGLSTLLGSWLIPVLAIPAMAGLMLRTPAEEAGLVARFGDGYRAYMARTGRYLPRWG